MDHIRIFADAPPNLFFRFVLEPYNYWTGGEAPASAPPEIALGGCGVSDSTSPPVACGGAAGAIRRQIRGRIEARQF